MPNWELWRRDPETGKAISKITGDKSEYDIARALSITDYKADELARFGVRDGSRLSGPVSAEVWLEEHPAVLVVAVWHAGTDRAAEVRKHELQAWWPALATALDNLEVNGGFGV